MMPGKALTALKSNQECFMAVLTIRNVDDTIKSALRVQAAQRGVSACRTTTSVERPFDKLRANGFMIWVNGFMIWVGHQTMKVRPPLSC
jgi:hypothetical protein